MQQVLGSLCGWVSRNARGQCKYRSDIADLALQQPSCDGKQMRRAVELLCEAAVRAYKPCIQMPPRYKSWYACLQQGIR
jgi:hypothetical protein